MREFESLAKFAEHLAVMSVAVVAAEHKALDRCAKLIENTAKSEIGVYQPEVGPFQDWAPLADSTESEKSRLGYPTGAPLLREGTLRDSIEHEVSGNEAVIGSKSDIAAYQEFGTDKIPPRSFIGPAAFRNKEKIRRIVGEAAIEGLTCGEVIHHSLGYDMEI
jgi:HK97 gp10 family phage protein